MTGGWGGKRMRMINKPQESEILIENERRAAPVHGEHLHLHLPHYLGHLSVVNIPVNDEDARDSPCKSGACTESHLDNNNNNNENNSNDNNTSMQ